VQQNDDPANPPCRPAEKCRNDSGSQGLGQSPLFLMHLPFLSLKKLQNILFISPGKMLLLIEYHPSLKYRQDSV
jgi:hypothetical protein